VPLVLVCANARGGGDEDVWTVQRSLSYSSTNGYHDDVLEGESSSDEAFDD